MSHLPFHKTLDQYDFIFQPSLDERQVRQLLTLQWVDGAENLIVLGPPGVGKTHWVVAMAVQAIVERIAVYCITLQDLVADLRKAWDENRFATRLGMYVRPRLLCIDEVGYLPLSPLEANLFFRLVAARYERGSLALTSNKGFVDGGPGVWRSRPGDGHLRPIGAPFDHSQYSGRFLSSARKAESRSVERGGRTAAPRSPATGWTRVIMTLSVSSEPRKGKNSWPLYDGVRTVPSCSRR